MRERESLLLELKRYTKSKLRSNIVEAEIHRKEQMHLIAKRAHQAANNVFVGVEAHQYC